MSSYIALNTLFILNLSNMDDKSKTGKSDDSRINVNESYELQYWSEKFNITAEELKEAVREAGSLAADVEKHLKQKT
ncbi:hypothetical protein GCM10011518_42130 [Flavobacterium limi]|uniref:DUF3606 domain-containing protein n=2 Tax=Flavobacterium limi TaxID=2045105 RepID=A0ABQ1UYI5_9FLAO|nr:hypothetical protein GCM10011518_42130 [Flavobacterium limi]